MKAVLSTWNGTDLLIGKNKITRLEAETSVGLATSIQNRSVLVLLSSSFQTTLILLT
jgi:hypothetical protein